ncbi:MAG: ATP-binding protein [Anaerolineaceae bacterium]|nr:ATP-binding protein [Anaerolineaceae bacterium]
MGLLNLFKGKKKETSKPAQEEHDTEKLSDPGQPTADTVDLVSVIAIDDPFLITREGAFVLMFEIPEIDMDIYGMTEREICERYQTALGALPPGTKFQMTVFEDPFDPSDDIRYFTERSEKFEAEIAYEDPISAFYKQGQALSASSIAMAARTAEIYDRVKPIRRRTVLTLYYLPGAANVARNIVMGQYAEADIAEIRKGKDSAVENLEERISVLQSAFSGAGLPLEQLDPADALNAVWRTMHPFSSNDPEVTAADIAKNLVLGQEIFKKDPPKAEEWTADLTPEQISGLLSPNYVIERKDMLEIDGVLMKGYVVYDFRPNRPTFMYRLNSLSGTWLGTLFVEVMDPAVAADKLSQRETQLSAQEMVKAKQGMLVDFGVRQEVSAVQESRMQLETAGQAPINIRFFVFRTALTKKELDKRCREMESLFKTIGVAAFQADYTQKHLWRSYIPLGVMNTEQKRRNMNAPSLSTFFWPQRKRYNEENGLYMGFDESTNLPLFLDPFGASNSKTPTFLSIGRPGAGKSVWLKTMMTSAMISGGRVMAVDIEGEMEEYCRYYGGRYIEVGTPHGELINVMDIQPDAEDPLIGGTEQLVAFAEAVRGAAIHPGPEWNVLADAYKRALIDREWLKENYDGSFEVLNRDGWRSEDAPLLGDIVDILRRDQSNPDALSMSQMLAQYVGNGVYASYFNRPTTFNIRKERLVIFGLKHVNTHSSSNQLRVYLWQILGLIWSEVLGRYMQDTETANHVMLDEVWALLKAPGGVGAIENMARRFRKRKAGLWMATQEVREFLDSGDAKKILSIVGNTFLMDQRPMEASLLENLYSLPEGTQNILTHLGTGRGLMVLPGKILRVSVSIPKEWHSYEVKS